MRVVLAVSFVIASCLAGSAAAGEPATPDAAAEARALAADGEEIFNNVCAYCHGRDAVQIEYKMDLRLLRRKYAERMEEVFSKTANEGRPSKGMPAWKDVLMPAQLSAILAYLKPMQTN